MKRRFFRVWCTAATGGFIILLLLAGWFLGPSGKVHGTEFSPDLFTHRSFSYYQFCGIRISPTLTKEWRTDLDKFLHEKGYVSESHKENPRWVFVKGSAPWVRGWLGDANSLCKTIGCSNGDNRWIEWSKSHPELADIVWPQVIDWVRNEQYEEVIRFLLFQDLENAKSVVEVHEKILNTKNGAGD